jgi:hypothetical protein
MTCRNCHCSLEEHDAVLGVMRCPRCGLHHTPQGEPEGWEVSVDRIPSGMVPYSLIEPYRPTDGSPITRVTVGSLIRAASIVGLRDMHTIREVLGQETMETAVDSVVARDPNDGVIAEA